MVSTEVQRLDEVDTADVPSAKWGWSKINYRSWHLAGLCAIILLVAFTHGNHHGHVEDIWVIAFAILASVVLIRDWVGRSRGWIR
ncbi:DUF2631 domain-containing protein [Mycolicibacterium brumae]|uniref:DUF2631 domain-containing protein n=1 Tax=Mycolicibacterium brumae TaxID=85968 RepID=A0A2G5P8M3_9MYCO|nr:DUF2631 domain-containing protein [Mycolicibacterium brumae]MCV7193886.1 DUF2631 domain-containing protein [Mycolicibacterium brumae]PIB74636.1 DUF2631 domain-containing protein [Mycolicibacterium brumae]RWA21804.1 hypothetical protein MBRU_13955 [Mycolicibacterium brumae DSM 44177]UWW08129.1 DUF2631 domain-containing protein [Mycolicibacterium brumae]